MQKPGALSARGKPTTWLGGFSSGIWWCGQSAANPSLPVSLFNRENTGDFCDWGRLFAIRSLITVWISGVFPGFPYESKQGIFFELTGNFARASGKAPHVDTAATRCDGAAVIGCTRILVWHKAVLVPQGIDQPREVRRRGDGGHEALPAQAPQQARDEAGRDCGLPLQVGSAAGLEGGVASIIEDQGMPASRVDRALGCDHGREVVPGQLVDRPELGLRELAFDGHTVGPLGQQHVYAGRARLSQRGHFMLEGESLILVVLIECRAGALGRDPGEHFQPVEGPDCSENALRQGLGAAQTGEVPVAQPGWMAAGILPARVLPRGTRTFRGARSGFSTGGRPCLRPPSS